MTAVTDDAGDRIPLRLAASLVRRCETITAPIASGTITCDLNVIGPTALPNPALLFASGVGRGELVGFVAPTCDK